MPDWTPYDIEVGYYTDLWGPYVFPFVHKLPAGDTLDSVDVRAFIGTVERTSDLTGLTEITSDLIDSGFTPAISNDTNVVVKFQYPGDDYKGESASLVFEITTTAGGKHSFYHHFVVIQ